MGAPIENPAKYQVRSVIWFPNVKKVKFIEIYKQIKNVYAENATNDSSVKKWCVIFKQERTSGHDGDRSERPSLVTEGLMGRVEEKFQESEPTFHFEQVA